MGKEWAKNGQQSRTNTPENRVGVCFTTVISLEHVERCVAPSLRIPRTRYGIGWYDLTIPRYTAPLSTRASHSTSVGTHSEPSQPNGLHTDSGPCMTIRRPWSKKKDGCQLGSMFPHLLRLGYGPCYVHPLFKDGMIPMMAIGVDNG
jgi:hypothetical protein